MQFETFEILQLISKMPVISAGNMFFCLIVSVLFNSFSIFTDLLRIVVAAARSQLNVSQKDPALILWEFVSG